MLLATATSDPLRASVLASVGNALLAAGDAAGADPWYRRSLALVPTGEMTAGNLAIASARQGLLDSARVQARRLLQAHPTSQPAQDLLAQLAGQPRTHRSAP
jgi:Flp pilus assembly protein TadD